MIKHKYNISVSREFTYPGIIKGGDWSSKITLLSELIQNSNKLLAFHQRFKEKKEWIETDFFKTDYNELILAGKKIIHKFHTLEEAELHYIKIYDPLYENIKENGILPSTKENNVQPIYVHIDKDGQIYYTTDATHRLAIVLTLNIKLLPVKVWMRHKEWQSIRESIFSLREKSPHYNYYKTHPDIESEMNT